MIPDTKIFVIDNDLIDNVAKALDIILDDELDATYGGDPKWEGTECTEENPCNDCLEIDEAYWSGDDNIEECGVNGHLCDDCKAWEDATVEPTPEELRQIELVQCAEILEDRIQLNHLRMNHADVVRIEKLAGEGAYAVNDLMTGLLVGRLGTVKLDRTEKVYLSALFDVLTCLGYLQNEFTLNAGESVEVLNEALTYFDIDEN